MKALWQLVKTWLVANPSAKVCLRSVRDVEAPDIFIELHYWHVAKFRISPGLDARMVLKTANSSLDELDRLPGRLWLVNGVTNRWDFPLVECWLATIVHHTSVGQMAKGATKQALVDLFARFRPMIEIADAHVFQYTTWKNAPILAEIKTIIGRYLIESSLRDLARSVPQG